MLLEILSHPIVAMIILLGVLVFVHEFGHYIIAKFCGVGVETFSIGFGPKLLSWKHNNTIYQIAAIPLGGYVKLAGTSAVEDVPEHYLGKEFCKASLLARASILIAGPLANLILAFVIHSGLAHYGIKHLPAVVGSVRNQSPALEAGLEPGDKIVEIAGQKIDKWSDMQRVISNSAHKQLEIKIKRNEQLLSLKITPNPTGRTNSWDLQKKGKGQIGIGLGEISSTITVLSPQSKAFSAGFRTADTVKEVQYRVFGKNEFKKVPTKTWGDLSKALQESLLKESVEMHFVIERKLEDKITSVLIKTFTKDLFSKRFYNQDYFSLKSLLRSDIGVVDSELTLDTVGESLQPYLKPKDVVVALNNIPINDIYDLSEFFMTNKKDSVEISFSRQGNLLSKTVPLKPIEQQEPEGKKIYYILDAQILPKRIFPDPLIERYDSVAGIVAYGINTTIEQSTMILQALSALVTGSLSVKSLGGPIMIAKVAGDSVRAGWEVFFNTMAVISVNLGIVNLFPIPVLDGGQLVLVFCEWIKRRPLSVSFVENFQKIGFVMLLCLVVLATYNDLSRFWSSILRGVVGN
jgi:regulator of sigma E protease